MSLPTQLNELQVALAKVRDTVEEIDTPMVDEFRSKMEGRRVYTRYSTTDFVIRKYSEDYHRSGVRFTAHNGKLTMVFHGVFTFKERIDSSAHVNVIYDLDSAKITTVKTFATEPKGRGKDMPEGARNQVAAEVRAMIETHMRGYGYDTSGYWKLLFKEAQDEARQKRVSDRIKEATATLERAYADWTEQ